MHIIIGGAIGLAFLSLIGGASVKEAAAGGAAYALFLAACGIALLFLIANPGATLAFIFGGLLLFNLLMWIGGLLAKAGRRLRGCASDHARNGVERT
jgi:hypothetical protein